MKLEKLFENIKNVFLKEEEKNIEVDKVVFDSRDVTKGSVFFCLKGTSTDGHDFLLESEKNGAVVAVVEKRLKSVKIPQIVVADTREALTVVCSNFYGNPEKSLKLVALVGTNGKTSTTHILKHIFFNAGKSVGVIGSLGYFLNNEHFECDLTTPDPTKLFEIFKFFKDSGVEFVFMEVSAHAIWLKKVHGLQFEVGALTNISQDHLDFFKTIENYKKTKLDFLKSSQIKTLLLNSDDISFDEFFDYEPISYGIKNPAECFALDIVQSLGKTTYALNLFDNVLLVETKLSGEFNVYNALLASSISLLLGLNVDNVKHGLETIKDVNGRFNVILTDKGELVLDFAHTPDALENILKSVKQASNLKNIIVLFGTSGNKDRLKRKHMGKIAERYCEEVVLTADDPKYENIQLIFEDILLNVKNNQKFVAIENRKTAISYAIDRLEPEKVLVICGKAGEKFQDINGVKVPYDDFEVVTTLLK